MLSWICEMAVAFLHQARKSETKTWGLRQIKPSGVRAAVQFGSCGSLVDTLFTGSVGVGGWTNWWCRAPQYPCWHTAPSTDLFKQLEHWALPASKDLRGHWEKGGWKKERELGSMLAKLWEVSHSSAIEGIGAKMAPSNCRSLTTARLKVKHKCW